MFALFELCNQCAIPDLSVSPNALCGKTACEPRRNSDPAVCAAVQGLVQAGSVKKVGKEYRGVAAALATYMENAAAVNVEFEARTASRQPAVGQ